MDIKALYGKHLINKTDAMKHPNKKFNRNGQDLIRKYQKKDKINFSISIDEEKILFSQDADLF